MLFLFVSLACLALFAAVFAATFAIDHFASTWQTADADSWHGRFSAWASDNKTLDIVKGLSGVASAAKDASRSTSPARAALRPSANFTPPGAS